MKYRKMLERCALLFIAGTALQLLVGDLNTSFLAYPWGVILAINYLYLLVMLYAFSDKHQWIKSLYDRRACLSSLASMLVLTLLFGLIPQDETIGGWVGALGFSRMTTSWIFNLFLFWFMTVIGFRVIDEVWHWKNRKKIPLFFHAAFFVIMVSAVFGSGDKVRIKVVSAVGHPVHSGLTSDGKSVVLPFSILLKEFSMDEYPPRVYLGRQGILSKNFVEVGKAGDEGLLDDWQVTCLQFLDMAGRMTEDSAFVSMNHVGATSAAYIKANHVSSGVSVEGWVSCGSHIFAGSTLMLPGGDEIVMPRREPKRYLSIIEIAEEDKTREVEIMVNHPARIGSWRIYQAGYDTTRGKWSTTSVLECVQDGWYPLVQVSMWIILLSGIMMFALGWKSRKKGKEEKR